MRVTPLVKLRFTFFLRALVDLLLPLAGAAAGAAAVAGAAATFSSAIIVLLASYALAFGGFLLIGDRLALAFASAGVRLGPLSANRKAFLMTDATVASDFFKTLDVERDFAAKIAFGLVLGNLPTEGDQLLISQILDPDVFGDIGVFADFARKGRADAVNIRKGGHDAFFIGDINPDNRCNRFVFSPLINLVSACASDSGRCT